jgi:hypothetical protein
MAERPLRILQIGTVESGGGAASVALNLARGCRSRGCEAWLAVGRKTSDDPAVFRIPDDRRTVYRLSGYAGIERRLEHMASRRPGRGWGRIARTLRFATHPRAWAAWYAGREDFEFPGTFDVLDLAPARPDLVHCHNLHGGYFDLRALPWLSRQVPTVLTLHDAWTLTSPSSRRSGETRPRPTGPGSAASTPPAGSTSPRLPHGCLAGSSSRCWPRPLPMPS